MRPGEEALRELIEHLMRADVPVDEFLDELERAGWRIVWHDYLDGLYQKANSQ